VKKIFLTLILITFITKGAFALLTGEVDFYSPAFSAESYIPFQYCYGGENLSPPLKWKVGTYWQ
jgi:phosphatidylethanolamine-binding protein (PEBP) family uncharacterized protein